MACRGSGVRVPSAPPWWSCLNHRTSPKREPPSLVVPFFVPLWAVWPRSAPRGPSTAAAARAGHALQTLGGSVGRRIPVGSDPIMFSLDHLDGAPSTRCEVLAPNFGRLALIFQDLNTQRQFWQLACSEEPEYRSHEKYVRGICIGAARRFIAYASVAHFTDRSSRLGRVLYAHHSFNRRRDIPARGAVHR
jgi:hypothetical protein